MRAFQEERAELRREGRPEAEMNALFEEVQAYVDGLFAAAPQQGAIGAFEGAYYAPSGYYRPAMNCLMFTRHEAFCPVCAAAIEETIDLYAERGANRPAAGER
jgi:hypothetical protein